MTIVDNALYAGEQGEQGQPCQHCAGEGGGEDHHSSGWYLTLDLEQDMHSDYRIRN